MTAMSRKTGYEMKTKTSQTKKKELIDEINKKKCHKNSCEEKRHLHC